MVSVLFARSDSIYKTLPDCDVWDIERDALKWPGGNPIVAHPPCRAWGQMKHFAKPREGERDLAIWAIEQIREWGGVLEHPAQSELWPFMNLPMPGRRDVLGGFSIWISQFWFGHKADKPTLLYIAGMEPAELPEIPFRLGDPDFVIASTVRKSQKGWKPHVPKAEREHTPPLLAKYLVELASRCRKPIDAASKQA